MPGGGQLGSKVQSRDIQIINEHIDHSHRILFFDVIVEPLGHKVRTTALGVSIAATKALSCAFHQQPCRRPLSDHRTPNRCLRNPWRSRLGFPFRRLIDRHIVCRDPTRPRDERANIGCGTKFPTKYSNHSPCSKVVTRVVVVARIERRYSQYTVESPSGHCTLNFHRT